MAYIAMSSLNKKTALVSQQDGARMMLLHMLLTKVYELTPYDFE